MMEVVVTTGAASRAKLQLNHHHQQTNIQLFTGRRPSSHPTNSVKALKEKAQKLQIKIAVRMLEHTDVQQQYTPLTITRESY